MSRQEPWRGDGIRRGLAAELGVDVADNLESIVDGLLGDIDNISHLLERERNNAIAFVSLSLASSMREE